LFVFLAIRWSTWIPPDILVLGTERNLRVVAFYVLVRCISQKLGRMDYLLLHACVVLHYLSKLRMGMGLGLPILLKVILLYFAVLFAFYDSQAVFAVFDCILVK
jgi:hypothetical protein